MAKEILSNKKFNVVLEQHGRWFTLYFKDEVIAKAGDMETATHYYWDLIHTCQKYEEE